MYYVFYCLWFVLLLYPPPFGARLSFLHSVGRSPWHQKEDSMSPDHVMDTNLGLYALSILVLFLSAVPISWVISMYVSRDWSGREENWPGPSRKKRMRQKGLQKERWE